jgi:predicted small lipoprotein YifL
MKKIITASLLVLALLLCAACGQDAPVDPTGTDTPSTAPMATSPDIIQELGEGETSFLLDVRFQDGLVKHFLVRTDETTLGAALLGVGLIEKGDNGVYNKVDGVLLDYDTDKAYWGFYINGDYAMQGLDETAIDPDATYELAYTK